MSLPGQNRYHLPKAPRPSIEYVLRHRAPLHRILSHTGKSIHDIINCPISRNIVRGYYKLSRQIDRSIEVTELERQWNPIGR